MPNHPSRRRRKDAPGRNPSPAEIRQLRDEMGMTQEAFGKYLYASKRTVEDWESGARRMPGLTWEYVSLLWGFRAVSEAREQWVRDLEHARRKHLRMRRTTDNIIPACSISSRRDER